MNLLVTTEDRFDRTPDGKVWTQTTSPYPYWQRYLTTFDAVRVAARVQEVPTATPGWIRADGKGVSFAVIPYYIGVSAYLRQFWKVQRSLRSVFRIGDAVILRVPSFIAGPIQGQLSRINYPYGVYVVGDPYDGFSPGAIKHFLRPFLRWSSTKGLQEQCAKASAAAYITEYALQRRYPCPNFSTNYSEIGVTGEDLVLNPRFFLPTKKSFTIITVGSLNHLYKAPEILIAAVAICVDKGFDLHLVFVGDGKHRSELQAQALGLGLGERVRFVGQLTTGDSVRAQLDKADLFILPSRQEGLPRAMIEAMARALPCIGSTVGGIPELLPSEDLVPPGDSAALAQKIREVLEDPARLEHMSARNLKIAREYRDDILRDRRLAFFRQVKEMTTVWLKRQGK